MAGILGGRGLVARVARAVARRIAPEGYGVGRLGGAVSAIVVAGAVAGAAAAAGADAPRYDAVGRLVFPGGYRGWVFLSSGIDMSYRAAAAASADHVFNNVFVPQAAYAAFMASGTWPDGTILILENRGAARDVSINKRGLVQTGAVLGLEAHVKDSARFKGGWGFFAFDGEQPAKLIPTTENCYQCHQRHGAVDTTFAQFYPTLLPIARQHATLSPAYEAEAKETP